jgi:hypothetical protein
MQFNNASLFKTLPISIFFLLTTTAPSTTVIVSYPINCHKYKINVWTCANFQCNCQALQWKEQRTIY